MEFEQGKGIVEDAGSKKFEFPFPPFPLSSESNIWEVRSQEEPIQVGNPTTRGKYRKYTAFDVILNETTAIRRFSEFVWLHDNLHAANPHVFLPPISKSFSKSTVFQRIWYLKKWINRVYNIPEARISEVMQNFLNLDRKAFKASIKATDKTKKRTQTETIAIEPTNHTYSGVDSEKVNKQLFVRYMLKYAKEFIAQLWDWEKTMKKMTDHQRKSIQLMNGVHGALHHILVANDASAPLTCHSLDDALEVVTANLRGISNLTHDFTTYSEHSYMQDLRDYEAIAQHFFDFVQAFLGQLNAHNKWRRQYEERILESLMNIDRVEAAQSEKAGRSSNSRHSKEQMHERAESRLADELTRHSDYNSVRREFEETFRVFVVQCERFMVNRSLEIKVILGKFVAFWRNYCFLSQSTLDSVLPNVDGIDTALHLRNLEDTYDDPIPIPRARTEPTLSNDQASQPQTASDGAIHEPVAEPSGSRRSSRNFFRKSKRLSSAESVVVANLPEPSEVQALPEQPTILETEPFAPTSGAPHVQPSTSGVTGESHPTPPQIGVPIPPPMPLGGIPAPPALPPPGFKVGPKKAPESGAGKQEKRKSQKLNRGSSAMGELLKQIQLGPKLRSINVNKKSQHSEEDAGSDVSHLKALKSVRDVQSQHQRQSVGLGGDNLWNLINERRNKMFAQEAEASDDGSEWDSDDKEAK
eukprot:c16120_g1_i1.p1 GENE.c16120_g1_i1~~c16120_g1_i1.p1  ORF type:complete len:714 (+),score=123.31 c16120_g1_i1:52-2142(+)